VDVHIVSAHHTGHPDPFVFRILDVHEQGVRYAFCELDLYGIIVIIRIADENGSTPLEHIAVAQFHFHGKGFPFTGHGLAAGALAIRSGSKRGHSFHVRVAGAAGIEYQYDP